MFHPTLHPFDRPYPQYDVGGEVWAVINPGVLLQARLVRHLVYQETEIPETAALWPPTREDVAGLIRSLRESYHPDQWIRYHRAHDYADVEVWVDAAGRESLLSPQWGRALGELVTTKSPGTSPVLGWRVQGEGAKLEAVVMPSNIPQIHGWVRAGSECEPVQFECPKGRPSPRHRLRVAKLLPHPWEPDVQGVRLAWMALNRETNAWEASAAPVVWPYSRPVVSLEDLRKLEGR